jgi:hypothetical protein|tara:strand:+ start:2930 stop:3385 length:456 start_codon:yes stop_codon:yes gene_type:complete
MNKDQLVEGPFGSNACYEQTFNHEGKEITTWLCFGSGFTTSTLMTKGSPVVQNAVASSPELYKDLMFEDKNNRVWLPATITLPGKGMVFVDGTNKNDWKWAAAKAIPLEEGDKKVSADQTHKMDMKNVKHYERNDFMEAADYIGMFKVNPL